MAYGVCGRLDHLSGTAAVRPQDGPGAMIAPGGVRGRPAQALRAPRRLYASFSVPPLPA
jgi:hypothetical protein